MLEKAEAQPKGRKKELSSVVAARQKNLRINDKLKGIRHLKLRVTSQENALIDAVRAEMSMSRCEATMSLFAHASKSLGILATCPSPVISSVRLSKDSEAAELLNELVGLTNLSAKTLITNALHSYMKSFV